MNYNQEDFQNMRYDVINMSNGKDFRLAFPDLAIYPEFKFDKHTANPQGIADYTDDRTSIYVRTKKGDNVNTLLLTQIMRFICFAYDRNSPLMSIENLQVRKFKALELAEFEKKDGKFSYEVEGLITGRYLSISRMIIRFLRIQRSTDFFTRIVYEEKLADTMLQMFSPAMKDDDVKDKDLIGNAEKLRGLIHDLDNVILIDERNPVLSKTLYDEIENEQLNLRPEDIAKKMKNNEMDDIWRIMPKGYVSYE